MADASGSTSRGVTIDDGKGDYLVIQSGSGVLKIRSTREIEISAPAISIEAASSMELRAAGKLVLKGALVEIN